MTSMMKEKVAKQAQSLLSYIILSKMKIWSTVEVLQTQLRSRIPSAIDNIPNIIEKILNDNTQRGIGGVGYLTAFSTTLKEIFSLAPNTQEIATRIFTPESKDWIFGNFSTGDSDPRFLSCDLIRKISTDTKQSINAVVFLRRLLIAKTFVDFINSQRKFTFDDLLELVSDTLKSQTNDLIYRTINQTLVGDLIKYKPDSTFSFLSEEKPTDLFSESSFSSFPSSSSSSTSIYKQAR